MHDIKVQLKIPRGANGPVAPPCGRACAIYDIL